jgi:metallo-beta-lactamase class B
MILGPKHLFVARARPGRALGNRMKRKICIFLLVLYSISAFAIDCSKIKENVWIHISYMLLNGYKTPSNGLVYNTIDGAVLIDTAWDNQQTKELCDFVKKNINKKILCCVISHAHEDRLGGVEYLRNQDIDVYMTKTTIEIAKNKHYLIGNKTLVIDDSYLKTYGINTEYLGAAHTKDNIVIYLEREKVLFGGCLLKSSDSENLGNIEDADVKSWKVVIEKMYKEYIDKNIVVVPGHGKYGGIEIIEHTRKLLK